MDNAMENDPLLLEQPIPNKTLGDDPIDEMNEKPKKKIKGKFIKNSRDLIFLIVLLSIEFIVNSGVALMIPFFPIEAERKGVSSSTTGIIISAYSLSSMFFAPIAGKTEKGTSHDVNVKNQVPYLGLKSSLFMGCAVEGTSRILFAFVDMIASKNIYIAVCIILRILMAAGSTYSLTTAMSAFLLYFPNHMIEANTFVEIVAGLGFTLAPGLGGFLYDVGGFKLPFMIFGTLTIASGFVGLIVLPLIAGNTKMLKKQKQSGSYLEVLKLPGIVVLGLINAMVYITTSFLYPVYSSYLISVDSRLSVGTIGIYIALGPIAYMATSPAAYLLGSKNMGGRKSLIFGMTVIALAYFMLASPVLLMIRPWIPAVIFGNTVIGVGLIFISVPIMPEMKNEIVKYGLKEDLATTSILAGIFQFSCFTGAVIGPNLSGILTQYLSFEVACATVMNLYLVELTGFLWFIWYTDTWPVQKSYKGS